MAPVPFYSFQVLGSGSEKASPSMSAAVTWSMSSYIRFTSSGLRRYMPPAYWKSQERKVPPTATVAVASKGHLFLPAALHAGEALREFEDDFVRRNPMLLIRTSALIIICASALIPALP